MTSLINFAAINENFPVAGQDNDTQVFRDNFDTIKTNFGFAKTEITDLQDNAARTDGDNDFLYNIVGSVTLQDAYLRKKDYGSPIGAAITAGTPIDISFKQAMYHVIKFGANTSLSFSEFPTGAVDITGLGQIGKATLELYGDDNVAPRIITFTTSGGAVIKKSPGFPGSFTVTSSTNPKFIEVWRHSATVIFLNYLGEYT